MSFSVIECVQRSPAWYAARVGLLTGSCADAVIAVRKRGSGDLKERVNLRQRLICERVTGFAVDEMPYKPFDVRRGEDMEAPAFVAYEAETGQLVRRVGFVRHDTMLTGASPDGYVGAWEGILELKCPKQTTHLGYLQARDADGRPVVPEEYRGQILHALWLTAAAWADFVSFDNRFPPPLDLFIVRTTREDVDLVAYELAVTLFLGEVDRGVEEVSKSVAPVAA